MTEDTIRFYCPKAHREQLLCDKFDTCKECWNVYLKNGGNYNVQETIHIEEGATI